MADTTFYTIPHNSKAASTTDEHGNYILIDKKDFKFAEAKVENDKYYIKVVTDGHLANPFSEQGRPRSKMEKLLFRDGESNFREVNKDCFEYYLTFLKTRNLLYYKFAERART